MADTIRRPVWEGLLRLRRRRGAQTVASFGLIVLGPLLTLATFAVLGPLDQGASDAGLRAVLLADLVYVLVVATLVLSALARMVAARRARSAGSRLHLRLTGVFALVALVPTVTVAIFAALTVNFGLEGWFSDRVRQAVGASLAAAQAYEHEQRTALAEDAQSLAALLNGVTRNVNVVSDRQVLADLQGAFAQFDLSEAYLVDGDGAIVARGENSYLFNFERPPAEALDRAAARETVVIEDWPQNEFRALVALDWPDLRHLYVTRDVDGDLLALLDDTQETATLYAQLENDRGRLLFEFGLLYLGFALILILAAIFMGMWFAERLSRPVGRLAGAAQRVGAGDLSVRVREEVGDDEIAMLGRLFNQMTRQLKRQRDTLVATNDQIERRRRLFDSVLSSVTAGVVGIDPRGRVTFVNRAAERLLSLDEEADQNVHLSVAVPEFGPLLDKVRGRKSEAAQEEIRVVRGDRVESLLVRIATRRTDAGRLEGYVLAFDDVSDLVAAQRVAAWGDVARRIAHEIKNPLTPIQLSAERIRRKFGREVSDEQALGQMTDVIVRQTASLRRIVDEFSQFARMPEPRRRPHDLGDLVRAAVLLQQAGQEDVTITADLPAGAMEIDVDDTMIGQALTNLIKNAGEATQTLRAAGAPEGYVPRIAVVLSRDGDEALVTVTDNGTGLPQDRARLFEPYVTTRSEGTGLGLPIVRKIVEEHGGTLILTDGAPFPPGDDPSGRVGARAEMRLPLPSHPDGRDPLAAAGQDRRTTSQLEEKA